MKLSSGPSTSVATRQHGRDPPFWDMVWESTPATDIFSLGSTFYTIMTGHWPYKSTHPIEGEDKWEYEDRVMASMKQGRYPDVGGMIGGTIMMGCWTKQYVTADEILQALKVEMREGATAATAAAAAAAAGGRRGRVRERKKTAREKKQRRQWRSSSQQTR